jgi:hypothetical protein
MLCGVAAGAATVLGLSSCGGSKSQTTPPADPVSMALKAPGVRSVIVPKQSAALTIVVPPCGSASLKQSSTATPPGSNQVVVPKSALDQTVAVQPCMQGSGQKNAEKSSTVLLSPGGSGSPQTAGQQAGTPQNQLLLPKNSNLSKIIVPPCVVQTSSSSSSSSGSSGGQSGGNTTVLPPVGSKTSVTAPPCQVQMSSSSSS